MNTPQLRLSSPIEGDRTGVLDRHLRDTLLIALTAVVPLVIALGIVVKVPQPEPFLTAGVIAGGIAVLALAISVRYEVTLALVVLYLGLLDGPIKLLHPGTVASGIRDVLIAAIGAGMLVRLLVGRQSVRLPPLSGWVLAFVAIVVVEAANPANNGVLKILGGYRQQLEWVPFFFFAYLLMRSKERFRKLFLILGVIALANGLVGTYQFRLSPGALASWGPGYNLLLNRTSSGGVGGRSFVSGGEHFNRPPALGSDAGFGGSIGLIALPCTLALLFAPGRRRRRWVPLVLCLGALLAIFTSASRTSFVIAFVTVAAFALLWSAARLRVTRRVAELLIFSAVVVTIGTVALVAVEGNALFAREETLTNGQGSEATAKANHLGQLPLEAKTDPFGAGLGVGGSVSGLGGSSGPVTIEGHAVSGESVYNLVLLEAGLPGLLLWVGLTLNVIALAVLRLRRIRDVELRTYLVAVFAAFIGFTLVGLSGPTLAVSPGGVFLWSVVGIAAYWLAGSAARTSPAIGSSAS
jgi:hypothetical protein